MHTHLGLSFLFLFSIYFNACTPPTETAKELPPPNILWIVSEDNGRFLGCYGDDYAITPNLDRLASQGVVYDNAFSSAPVCAPSRSTLITGVYPPSMGTQHMRSKNNLPDSIRFFPHFLVQAGYYCTNPFKTDYNVGGSYQRGWSDMEKTAHYKNRKPGQPFFHVFNTTRSHESSIHRTMDSLYHDPEKAPIPPYHPSTPEMKHDWAQYYSRVTQMDSIMGAVLQELEESGLADSTIIFYYSDHGGVLARSKRFLFESGLHIPLIVKFPEMYKHLAPGNAGSRTDRIVTFLDFAPTVLSLAGVNIPDYMQGHAFLGKHEATPREYAHCFRGRMDERFDLSRAVRDKQYLYVRHYMPHRPFAQYIQYLWRAPSMRSWEREYLAGNLNEVQSAFFEPKPAEQLFDAFADPHNINNLADSPDHQEILKRMRAENARYVRESFDSGFFPEGEMIVRAGDQAIYNWVRGDLPRERIIETADLASMGKVENLNALIERFSDPEAAVRYWAATGCIILRDQAVTAKTALTTLKDDPSPSVRIAAAEALYYLGDLSTSLAILAETIKDKELMVRVHAINVLEIIGKEAAPIADQLKALAKPAEDRSYDNRALLKLLEVLAG